MKTSEVIEFFGSARLTAEALGMTPAAVHNWGETVPATRQAHVELATKGKIKRDKPVYGRG